MPGFLGGSDLAVPISANKALAADWIADFTSTQSRRLCRRRATSRTRPTCSGASVNERAAARSWFVPTAKHWVNVENGNILRNMLAQILTGKLTIQQAARRPATTSLGPERSREARNAVRRAASSPDWRPPPRPRSTGLGGGRSLGADARAARARTS